MGSHFSKAHGPPLRLLLVLQEATSSGPIPSDWNWEITSSQDTRPVLKDVKALQPSTAIMVTSCTSIKMHPASRSRRSTSITKGTSFTTTSPFLMRQSPYFSQTLLTLGHSSD